MSKLAAVAPTACVLTAAALGLAATAAADPFDNGGADEVVKDLKDQGYNVQVNGANNAVPLSRCTATGIHPSNLNESASLQEKQHTLVQVDVTCPSH